MRSKLLSGTAAFALTAATVLVSAAPASAAPWGWHRGWGWGWPGAVAAGVVGGAVAAATSPLWAPGYYSGYYDYYPGYGPSYAYTAPTVVVQNGGSVAYCQQRFRSYNPSTGMYLGYDGRYHPCP